MRIEEMFTIISAFFLGQLSAVVDAYYHLDHPSLSRSFNMLNLFSLIFWGFAIYFVLKYAGIICRKKK